MERVLLVQNRGANRIHIMTAMEKRYGKRL